MPNDQGKRRAATDTRQIEPACRRVRLTDGLGMQLPTSDRRQVRKQSALDIDLASMLKETSRDGVFYVVVNSDGFVEPKRNPLNLTLRKGLTI